MMKMENKEDQTTFNDFKLVNEILSRVHDLLPTVIDVEKRFKYLDERMHTHYDGERCLVDETNLVEIINEISGKVAELKMTAEADPARRDKRREREMASRPRKRKSTRLTVVSILSSAVLQVLRMTRFHENRLERITTLYMKRKAPLWSFLFWNGIIGFARFLLRTRSFRMSNENQRWEDYTQRRANLMKKRMADLNASLLQETGTMFNKLEQEKNHGKQ